RQGAPYPDRMIDARGTDEPAQGAECHAEDVTTVAAESGLQLPTVRVPDLHALGGGASRGDTLAIRADCQAPSLACQADGARQLPGSGVPHLPRFVETPRDEALAVRAVDHRVDAVGVALKTEGLQPRLGVPHPHRLVHARGGDVLPIG